MHERPLATFQKGKQSELRGGIKIAQCQRGLDASVLASARRAGGSLKVVGPDENLADCLNLWQRSAEG